LCRSTEKMYNTINQNNVVDKCWFIVLYIFSVERHKLTHARPQDFMKPKLEANNSKRPTGVAVQRVVRCGINV
jgi:hypothetical protein